MQFLKTLLILAMLMASMMTYSATSSEEKLPLDDDEDVDKLEAYDTPNRESPEATSLRGVSRLLASRAAMTCNKYPRVCHVAGSPGPDCCKKKCVNVKTDRLNCGYCGKKCKYSEICCKGKCVNPRNDKKNCGGCNIKCKKGNICVYGMCSYA
ncbi:hypothetical protein NMG60_11009861 [Bertholletia excelsa]